MKCTTTVDDGGGVGRRGSGVLPVYVATVMSSTKQKPMLTMRVGRVLGVFHKALLNEYTDLFSARKCCHGFQCGAKEGRQGARGDRKGHRERAGAATHAHAAT